MNIRKIMMMVACVLVGCVSTNGTSLQPPVQALIPAPDARVFFTPNKTFLKVESEVYRDALVAYQGYLDYYIKTLTIDMSLTPLKEKEEKGKCPDAALYVDMLKLPRMPDVIGKSEAEIIDSLVDYIRDVRRDVNSHNEKNKQAVEVYRQLQC